MTNQTDYELSQAYDFLKSSNLERSQSILEEALSNDLDNKEILYTLKCINFWKDKLDRARTLPTAFERGESIILNWKLFSSLMGLEGQYFEKSLYALKQGVFSLAVEYYQTMFREHGNDQGPEIYRKIGLCFKKLGDYETSLNYLERANSLGSDSPAILAEMADCYALCGEEKTAKILFREAFFIDAQKVDLSLLDSELISRLVEKVSGLGYKGSVLLEWIPVYGVLFSVFSVKRELRALEFGKLKQTIYALENGLKEAGNEPSLLIPRLINHYFWLIDHYLTTNDEGARINEILLKIKILDSSIWSKYTT